MMSDFETTVVFMRAAKLLKAMQTSFAQRPPLKIFRSELLSVVGPYEEKLTLVFSKDHMPTFAQVVSMW